MPGGVQDDAALGADRIRQAGYDHCSISNPLIQGYIQSCAGAGSRAVERHLIAGGHIPENTDVGLATAIEVFIDEIIFCIQ